MMQRHITGMISDTDMTHAHTYYTVARPCSLWMIDRALTQADSDFQVVLLLVQLEGY
jgi:hypothetical protein